MGLLESLLLSPAFAQQLQDDSVPGSRVEDVVPKLDMQFIYSLAWSLGGVTDEQGRRAMTEHLRRQIGTVHQLPQKRSLRIERACQIPEGAQTAYDYYVDKQRWVSWRDSLRNAANSSDLFKDEDESSHLIMVPTTESMKIARLLELC